MTSLTLSTFLCVVTLTSMTWVRSQMFQGPCDSGWVYNNRRCLQYISDKKSWIDAELNCVSIGGNLASENSDSDHAFLEALQKSAGEDGPYWLGLSDCHKEGEWMWSDGGPVDYTKWHRGEPNNAGEEDCVSTNWGGTMDWNDANCNKPYPSVCAKRLSY